MLYTRLISLSVSAEKRQYVYLNCCSHFFMCQPSIKNTRGQNFRLYASQKSSDKKVYTTCATASTRIHQLYCISLGMDPKRKKKIFNKNSKVDLNKHTIQTEARHVMTKTKVPESQSDNTPEKLSQMLYIELTRHTRCKYINL